MVKFDVSLVRFLDEEDFRVLTALEMCLRNHELAPTALIERVAQLPHGGTKKKLSQLLKLKLFIVHENTVYDGYRMKYGAYDYLALRTFSKRRTCAAVGHRIGCGKESDIFTVVMMNNTNMNADSGNSYLNPEAQNHFSLTAYRNEMESIAAAKAERQKRQAEGAAAAADRAEVDSMAMGSHLQQEGDAYGAPAAPTYVECVLKLQRLGRCSFRSVTRNRDYFNKNKKSTFHKQARRGESWFYLSRLAAQKEFMFMKVLFDEGFPVPRPIDQNRHAIIMEKINGHTLNNISEFVGVNVGTIYKKIIYWLKKFAESGLIHGDLNEFNIMVTEETMEIYIIDFPQMVSTNHPNAAELFARDLDNINTFFARKFKLGAADGRGQSIQATLQNCDHPEHPQQPRRAEADDDGEATYLVQLDLKTDIKRKNNIDEKVFASGFYTQREEEDLERLLKERWAELEGERARREQRKHDQTDETDHEDSSHEEEEDDDDDDEEEEDNDDQYVPLPSEDAGIDDDHDDDDDDHDDDHDGGDDGDEEETEATAHRPPVNRYQQQLLQLQQQQQQQAQQQLRQDRVNANFHTNGELNEDHVKNQIRKNLKRKDNKDFYSGMARNAQKGKQKKDIRRQLKGAKGQDMFE